MSTLMRRFLEQEERTETSNKTWQHPGLVVKAEDTNHEVPYFIPTMGFANTICWMDMVG